MQENVISKTIVAASNAHRGQFRKYTGEPYVTHPMAVAMMVSEYLYGKNYGPEDGDYIQAAICAALLHDTVEDCGWNTETIIDLYDDRDFGVDVAELVMQVTRASKKEDGNRATRKAIDRKWYAGATYRAKVIKTFDVIHNATSFIEHDPDFCETVIPEYLMLIHAFDTCTVGRIGDDLIQRAYDTLDTLNRCPM